MTPDQIGAVILLAAFLAVYLLGRRSNRRLIRNLRAELAGMTTNRDTWKTQATLAARALRNHVDNINHELERKPPVPFILTRAARAKRDDLIAKLDATATEITARVNAYKAMEAHIQKLISDYDNLTTQAVALANSVEGNDEWDNADFDDLDIDLSDDDPLANVQFDDADKLRNLPDEVEEIERDGMGNPLDGGPMG